MRATSDNGVFLHVFAFLSIKQKKTVIFNVLLLFRTFVLYILVFVPFDILKEPTVMRHKCHKTHDCDVLYCVLINKQFI